MNNLKHAFCALMLLGLVSCGASTDKNSASQNDTANTETEMALIVNAANIDVINAVYRKFVFSTDEDVNALPETYFTANALKKLQDDYEFDSVDGPCYAFYALRTEEQDSCPEADDISLVRKIEPGDDGWYIVSYSDMGWNGKTRVKITDGKIDDYQRMDL